MKYKVGDRVRIKSLDWYNENKGNADKTNSVWCADGGVWFFYHMSQYCGKIITIENVWTNSYTLEGSDSRWTDEMIEGLAEEEMSLDKAGQITDFEYEGLAYTLPEGYIFKDENGNIINATKIVLEKKSPKTDDIIKWLREHDMTKYIGVIYSGMCSITFDTEKFIKDITEMIGDE